jgi:adenine-specific DNA-methyltransferase
MMSREASRTNVQEAIQAFDGGNLRHGATQLLKALGYSSDKTLELSPNSFAGFFAEFGQYADHFNRSNAKADDWQSADILFQITDEDLSGSHTLFDSKALERDRFNSLLFMAIGLVGEGYTRTDLARITREVNKCFAMPVVILFRYGNRPSPLTKRGAREGGGITLAVIQRRRHKSEAEKDVLEKVTLIKDVNITRPHRAHIEILTDLALDQLAGRKKHRIQSFETLFSAWQEALDTSELNKRFYKELSNWYFWALTHAKFPKPPQPPLIGGVGGVKEEERNSVALIRLITRLIFVWFLKEKELVPEALFDKERVNLYLADKHKIDGTAGGDSPTRGGAAYYRAILQNLFFATLNTDMNRDQPDSRGFKTASRQGQRYNDEYMAHTRYRYSSYFKDPDEALKLFEDIPFLNGGLFECLDKPAAESPSGQEERIDGFSDDPRKQAALPDFLFFGEDDIDLNEIYGTKGKRLERVRGILRIFERYKFTIDENTPVEEEVALDPELLGKVFENLLASYNPKPAPPPASRRAPFILPVRSSTTWWTSPSSPTSRGS